jgi:hypothetical protein
MIGPVFGLYDTHRGHHLAGPCQWHEAIQFAPQWRSETPATRVNAITEYAHSVLALTATGRDLIRTSHHSGSRHCGCSARSRHTPPGFCEPEKILGALSRSSAFGTRFEELPPAATDREVHCIGIRLPIVSPWVPTRAERYSRCKAYPRRKNRKRLRGRSPR